MSLMPQLPYLCHLSLPYPTLPTDCHHSPGATGGGGLLESGIPGVEPSVEEFITMIFKNGECLNGKLDNDGGRQVGAGIRGLDLPP